MLSITYIRPSVNFLHVFPWKPKQADNVKTFNEHTPCATAHCTCILMGSLRVDALASGVGVFEGNGHIDLHNLTCLVRLSTCYA